MPALGLLGWGALMLTFGTALQYPGHVPEDIWITYLMESLVFLVPAVLAQSSRLVSIGLPWWAVFPLSFVQFLMYCGVFTQSNVVGAAGTAIWVAALLLLPPGVLRRPVSPGE